MYKVQVSIIEGDFSLPSTLSQVDKGTLMAIPSLRYVDMVSKYQHLKSIVINTDVKPKLPMYVMLGASKYTKGKSNSVPTVRQPGEPNYFRTHSIWLDSNVPWSSDQPKHCLLE